ncbi:MAG: aminomethyl-transferring glycine dehydrogenase subunit GcvPA [Chloroflexi bacterium]|nr:aminomethyl-transferring glycine dehydrogenase subunit GcvPA [Chloroflexota bacterium]
MFHPQTDANRTSMLKKIGARSIEELFEVVPEKYRYPALDLPDALTEIEVLADLQEIASANENPSEMPSFLGAGAYSHYIPAAVDAVLSRGEFYTAYTPYQPEISQGTLQAVFEYQSLITYLTGMEVSNASHYDGATAAAEAVNMARLIHRNKRSKVILSPSLHPQYRATLKTYALGSDTTFVGEDLDLSSGPEALLEYLDEDTALVYVQYPDFFGRIYDYAALAETVHEAGSLLAVSVNPTSLGMLKPPGDFGADIVTGEGQPLGIPLSYGGPYLGILATRQNYVRSLAGRLVGETTDTNGQRGFVLTLSTREQHIRREKASSNICTNQGLMTLAATVYLSVLGKQGLREVAELCYQKAHYTADQIAKLPGFELWSSEPFFHEFVMRGPRPAAEINQDLLEHDIIGGYDLGLDSPELADCLLFAVTETNSQDEIDYLVSVLAEVPHG